MAHDSFLVSLALEPSSPDVPAGTAFALRARASCPEAFELSGEIVSFLDGSGNTVATAALEESETGFATTDVAVVAPDALGARTFTGVLEPAHSDEARHSGATAEAVIQVVAHTVYLNVWDVPSAVPAGSSFTFHVGAKCSCGCDLSLRSVALRNNEGARIARARLRKGVWPNTSALHFAPIKTIARADIVSAEWTVEFVASTRDPLHGRSVAPVAIRTVEVPEHQVTVHVVDAESGAPLEGIVVLLHPYRALTDRKGTARVAVAGQFHRLHVSGRKYLPFQGNIDASDGANVRVRLAIERTTSPFHPPIYKQEPSTMEVL